MEKDKSNRLSAGERRFIAAAFACAALCVIAAFWFAVPFAEDKGSAGEYKAVAMGEAAKVDLNSAGLEALCTLPNVGEAKARAIIEYRLAHGGFESVAEAAEVDGITQKTVESWADLAYVSR